MTLELILRCDGLVHGRLHTSLSSLQLLRQLHPVLLTLSYGNCLIGNLCLQVSNLVLQPGHLLCLCCILPLLITSCSQLILHNHTCRWRSEARTKLCESLIATAPDR